MPEIPVQESDNMSEVRKEYKLTAESVIPAKETCP